MKNLLVILLFAIGFSMTASAQYTASVPIASGPEWQTYALPYYTAGDDTASGADVIRMGTIMNDKYDVNIKVVVTKISGTIATTSSIQVRASPDGVNWYNLGEAGTKSYKDTVFMANATTTAVFSFTGDEINAKYIEVYYDQTTGTSPLTAPVATLYFRKSRQIR